jgi:diguanylate cyclase (GGDEF)-like protein
LRSSASRRCCSRSRSPSSSWPWPRSAPNTGIAPRRGPTSSPASPTGGFLEQTAVSRRIATGDQPAAVLLFDLDHFKHVNDRYGHAIGDRTLQIFADTAKAQVGDGGLVGRWGGDEFVAALYNTSRDHAATVAERIQLAFEKAGTEIDGRPVRATVSTGLAYSVQGPFELPALLLQADQALYRAKSEGRNRLAVATPEIIARSIDQPLPAGSNVVPLDRRSAA